MKQHLVVEGKDYYFIGELCKAHFSVPKGFNKNNQKSFLIGGNGYDQTLIDFLDALKATDLTNIGLIVDANFKGVNHRFREILYILSSHFKTKLDEKSISTEGALFEIEGVKIGIWIMPNNVNNGYLEHFIESMIENNDIILKEAKGKISELMSKDYCRFTEIKSQKAILHSWLAWQETPGLPFGTALRAGYFDKEKESVKPFLNWIKNTFEF
jgi:hypothetical protein